jgi:hypothetical protein
MKTSFEKFMASNAVNQVELSEVKVDLAVIQDIDKLIVEIEKIGNAGKGSALKAVEKARSINPLLVEARQGYNSLNTFTLKASQLYTELSQQYKALGISLPSEIENKFKKLQDTQGALKSAIITLMLESKNVIDNRY